MAYDTERSAEKLDDLGKFAASGLSHLDTTARASAAAYVVQNFARVTPPEKGEARLELITLDRGGIDGGTSTKPGNILLNMRKLVATLAGGALTIVGSTHSPWTLLLGALVVWDSIYSGSQVALSEREAAIVWTMWLKSDDKQTIPHAQLLPLVNDHLERHGRGRISPEQLADSLRILERMRCIQRSGTDPSRWWLREWVSVKYR